MYMARTKLAAIGAAALVLCSCSSDNIAKSEGNSSETSSSSEFWSVLDNLPDFDPEFRTTDGILWVDGLPLGANPLTYDDGSYITGVYATDGHIDMTATEVSAISTVVTDDNPSDEYIVTTTLESDPSTYVFYIPGGYDDEDNHYLAPCYKEYPSENDMTIGDVFSNNLYTSQINIKDFPGYSENASAEENLNTLIAYFGKPSCLYWYNSMGTMYKQDLQAQTFEEFKALPKGDSERGSKNFYIVWRYGLHFVALKCYDDERYSNETTFVSLISAPTSNLDGIFRTSGDAPKDGYVGYGYVPAVIAIGNEDVFPE